MPIHNTERQNTKDKGSRKVLDTLAKIRDDQSNEYPTELFRARRRWILIRFLTWAAKNISNFIRRGDNK